MALFISAGNWKQWQDANIMPFLDYMILKTLFSKNVQWPMEILMSCEMDTAKSLPYSRIPVSYNMCAGEKIPRGDRSQMNSGYPWVVMYIISFILYWVLHFLPHPCITVGTGYKGSQKHPDQASEACGPAGVSLCVPPGDRAGQSPPRASSPEGACRDSCRDSAQNWPFYFIFSFFKV